MDIEDKEDTLEAIGLDKDAKWEEVYSYALNLYNGNDTRATSFVRGWFATGERIKAYKAADALNKPSKEKK